MTVAGRVVDRMMSPVFEIETCPRDGRWFLAFSPDAQEPRWRVTYWRRRMLVWRPLTGRFYGFNDLWRVTHWMPLPPAPGGSGGGV